MLALDLTPPVLIEPVKHDFHRGGGSPGTGVEHMGRESSLANARLRQVKTLRISCPRQAHDLRRAVDWAQ